MEGADTDWEGHDLIVGASLMLTQKKGHGARTKCTRGAGWGQVHLGPLLGTSVMQEPYLPSGRDRPLPQEKQPRMDTAPRSGLPAGSKPRPCHRLLTAGPALLGILVVVLLMKKWSSIQCKHLSGKTTPLAPLKV